MTEKFYHHNQYLQTFVSDIIGQTTVNGAPGIILTQTAFYPTSGGQPHDLGTLNGVAVLDVFENENQEIVHVLEKPIEAHQVEGRILWERRFDHIQQHTGQHLLSQACLRVAQAETVSFHLGGDASTIDVNRSGIDAAALAAIEMLANQIIYENRDVRTHVVSKDEISKFPLRKSPTVEEQIRIVEIHDFDYSPCGGTHCSRTGEIGMIKIKKCEQYKDGSRIHFVCGRRALQDYQAKTEIVRALSNLLSSGESDLPANTEKLLDEMKTLRRTSNELTGQLLDYEAKSLLIERESIGNFHLLAKIFPDRNPKDIKFLANKVLELSPNTVILFGGAYDQKASLLFMRSDNLPQDMNRLMKTACAALNGRGGGQASQAQGGGTDVTKLEAALQEAKSALLER